MKQPQEIEAGVQGHKRYVLVPSFALHFWNFNLVVADLSLHKMGLGKHPLPRLYHSIAMNETTKKKPMLN